MAPIPPSRKRNALANTFFGITSTVLSIVTAIVFVPLYLSYVGTVSYGVWLASGNVLAWLSIIDPGIGDLARQRIAALLGAGRWAEVRSSLSCGLVAVTAVAVIVVLAGTSLAGWMVAFLRVEDLAIRAEATQAIRVAAVGTALVMLGNYLCGAVQGLQLSTSVGVIGIAAALAVPILRLSLLSAGFSLASFAWATVGQGVLLCVASGVILGQTLRRHPPGPWFSPGEMRYLFSMSLFTSFSRIAGTIYNNMLAALVMRHLGPSAAVSFEMTRQPIEIARTFLDKPASAFLPSFAHLSGEHNPAKLRHYVARYLQYLIWTLGLAVVGFATLNQAFVTVWLGPELFAGAAVNGLLIAVLVTVALGNTCRVLLYSFGHVAVSSVASLAETIACLIIAVIAIHFAGTAGLAASPLLAFLLVGLWIMPRMILRDYLCKPERSLLVREGVLPAFGATIGSAGALWLASAGSLAEHGWGSLVLSTIMATCIYLSLLMALSADARADARSCFARMIRPSRKLFGQDP